MNTRQTIRIFVGTDPRMRMAEIALEHTVRTQCTDAVDIVWMDRARGGLWAGWDIGRVSGQPYVGKGWATDFSCFRFAVPEASGFRGRALYLDVDMLVLKDLAELVSMQMERPVVMTPTGYDVTLFDCAAFREASWWPPVAAMKSSGWGILDYHRLLSEHAAVAVGIPPKWNCRDGEGFDARETALVHFTDMRTQPWKPYPDVLSYRPHPRPDMAELWWRMYREATARSRLE